MLAARIDRLPSEDKRLLQTAAVVGKDVPFAVLQAIAVVIWAFGLYALMPANPDPVLLSEASVRLFRALSLAGLVIFWAGLGLGRTLLARVGVTPHRHAGRRPRGWPGGSRPLGRSTTSSTLQPERRLSRFGVEAGKQRRCPEQALTGPALQWLRELTAASSRSAELWAEVTR